MDKDNLIELISNSLL